MVANGNRFAHGKVENKSTETHWNCAQNYQTDIPTDKKKPESYCIIDEVNLSSSVL